MGDILSWAFFIAGFFGLEIVAIFVLIMSALFGRQLGFVILCGVVAAVLMAIESFVWWICVGGIYDFGLRCTPALISVSAISIVCLGIYFPIAIKRCKRKQTSAAPKAASAIPQ